MERFEQFTCKEALTWSSFDPPWHLLTPHGICVIHVQSCHLQYLIKSLLMYWNIPGLQYLRTLSVPAPVRWLPGLHLRADVLPREYLLA